MIAAIDTMTDNNETMETEELCEVTKHYFEDFANFRSVNGGNLIIVGERHVDEQFEELMQDVAVEYDANAYAIERTTAPLLPRSSGGGAMGQATRCADEDGVPLIAIDGQRGWRSVAAEQRISTKEVLNVANKFIPKPDGNGCVHEDAARKARQAVYELYGEDLWREMYVEREEAMAGHLQWMVNQYGGPVIAAVGAFHVDALVERYKDTISRQPSSERITEYTND